MDGCTKLGTGEWVGSVTDDAEEMGKVSIFRRSRSRSAMLAAPPRDVMMSATRFSPDAPHGWS